MPCLISQETSVAVRYFSGSYSDIQKGPGCGWAGTDTHRSSSYNTTLLPPIIPLHGILKRYETMGLFLTSICSAAVPFPIFPLHKQTERKKRQGSCEKQNKKIARKRAFFEKRTRRPNNAVVTKEERGCHAPDENQRNNHHY